jgi:hypothetical protein
MALHITRLSNFPNLKIKTAPLLKFKAYKIQYWFIFT